MEDIKKWHEAIKRPEDKGPVEKTESERGLQLFQKPSASLRDLKAKWKQHKEIRLKA